MQRTLIGGLDIGGTKCAAVLGITDGKDAEVAGRKAFPTPDSPGKAIGALAGALKELVAAHPEYMLRAIGISCGGPLDSARGVVQSPPNLPGWDDIDVVSPLRQAFDVPVALQNDANACALAEWRWGAGRGSRNMVFLTFGTGLGAGIVLDGKVLDGSSGFAGEVGHLRLTDDGPQGYGKRGSFEGWCSGGGIVRAALEYHGFAEGITAAELARLARDGNAEARAVYEHSARMLGRGLALLVDVLNPDRIVIGSIYARQRELMEPVMLQVMAQEALPGALAACRVVPAGLGDAVGDMASLSVALSVCG